MAGGPPLPFLNGVQLQESLFECPGSTAIVGKPAGGSGGGAPVPFDDETLGGRVDYSAFIEPTRYLKGELEGLVIRYETTSPRSDSDWCGSSRRLSRSLADATRFHILLPLVQSFFGLLTNVLI
jgi:hypothetical protein